MTMTMTRDGAPSLLDTQHTLQETVDMLAREVRRLESLLNELIISSTDTVTTTATTASPDARADDYVRVYQRLCNLSKPLAQKRGFTNPFSTSRNEAGYVVGDKVTIHKGNQNGYVIGHTKKLVYVVVGNIFKPTEQLCAVQKYNNMVRPTSK